MASVKSNVMWRKLTFVRLHSAVIFKLCSARIPMRSLRALSSSLPDFVSTVPKPSSRYRPMLFPKGFLSGSNIN